MARLEVPPEAELDALEAMLWYEGERDGLGGEFLQELRATFVRIEETPLQVSRRLAVVSARDCSSISVWRVLRVGSRTGDGHGHHTSSS
jgi:hypothetical protein